MKNLLLSPDGRVGRRTYAVSMSGVIAAGFVLGLLPLVGPLLLLPLTWPFACLTVKRLHDAGRRGWPVAIVTLLCLVTTLVTITLGVLASNPGSATAAFTLAAVAVMLGGVTTVAAIALLVWAALGRSDPSANRFGDREERSLTFADLTGRTRVDAHNA